MTSLSERLGNWFPVVVAAALPVVFTTSVVDAFILPRTSLVIAGACLGTGLALFVPRRPMLGQLRWPLAAAAVAAVIAFIFSTSWPLSLIGSYSRYESLPVRLSYLGLLAVPVWLLRSELTRSLAVMGFVLGTTISATEALAQWVLQVGFRPDGNLGNANLLGALIALALPICLANMFRPGWITGGWWAAATLLIGGLVVSNSRSGGVGALAGCLAVGVFALRGRWAALAAGGSLLAVVGAVVAVLVSPLRNLNGDPGPTRVHLYHDGAAMIAARPLTGWGEDSTGLALGRFLTGDWSPGVTFDRLHSGLLDLAATQGLLGVAALGWVVVVLLLGFWKSRFEPVETPPRIVGALTISSIAGACIGYTAWVLVNFDWAPATGPFWLLAGIGWSVIQARRPQTDAPASGAFLRLGTLPRLGAALLLVVATLVFGALPLLADAWYANGRSELAARADPLQSQYHRALGELLIQEGRADEGRGELRLAANLGATDPALYVELGDADLRAGDVSQARTDYQMALTIDPFWAPARQRLAGGSGRGAA